MAMQYSTTNLMVSFSRHLADFLKDEGFNIRWHATGDVETYTTGPEEDTITMVDEIPANPSYLTTLNSGSPDDHEVPIPALAVQVGDPQKAGRLGLGDSQFFREREVMVDGFAITRSQWRKLADLLYDWLDQDGRRLTIWDYESNPSSPPALTEPAWVPHQDEGHPDNVQALRQELVSDDYDAIRYYLRVTVTLRFVE